MAPDEKNDGMPDFSGVTGGDSTTAKDAQGKPVEADVNEIYVVVSGDSLSKIAKHKYGNAGLWQRIYEANTGLLNTFLRGIGLEAIAHPWLGDPATALGAVIAVSVWKNVGFSLVILLAGLQGLPRDVIDAARVDGADAWQLTTRVIAPLMRPILALTALLSIIGGLKVFDLVFIMTRGGPTYSTEVLATMLYRQAFELNEMGAASAIAVIPVALVLGTAWLQTLLLREGGTSRAG